jgi:hypothetical protein
MDVSVNILKNIEKRLERIEDKMDNFLGLEEISREEMRELDIAKKEMKKGKCISLENLRKKLSAD